MNIPEIKNNRAAILYGRIPDNATQDDLDVLTDVKIIEHTLTALGYQPFAVPLSINLGEALARLREIVPLFVFNLVDAIDGHDSLLHLAPSLLEAYRIPFTGVGTAGNFCTTDKILAKEIMRSAGIPTAPWQRLGVPGTDGSEAGLPCIVKPIAMDASRGMDATSVCRDAVSLKSKIASFKPADIPDFFTEAFIEGREFNVSLIGTADGVQVRPPAEITFVDFPPDMPTIVDFKAKWDASSFEYAHTVRVFDFPPGDAPLLDELKTIALKCWEVFNLCGYARVDFRVDRAGRPWVLEANANPCISPDAGFVAAGERAGYSFEQTIQLIIEDALRRNNLTKPF